MAKQYTAQFTIRDEDGKLVTQGSGPVDDGKIHVGPFLENPTENAATSAAAARPSVADRLSGKR
jgi:hypothetical protein